jgi:hypothetical protein
VLTEPFDNLTGWTTAGTTSSVTGRTGNAAQCNGSSGEVSKALSTSDAYATIGVAFYMVNTATNYYDPSIITLYQGTTPQVAVAMVGNSASGFSITRGDGNANFLAATTAGAMSGLTSQWNYLELQARIHATLGFVTLRLNGVVAASATNVNTVNGGTAVVDKVSVGCGAPSQVLKFDDLYVSLGSGCSFQGDHTISTRFP